MAEIPVRFYRPGESADPPGPADAGSPGAIESSTCVEAEPFALRVLDDSMQPEFRRGCIIVIDPTGHARDGSFVLARNPDAGTGQAGADGELDENGAVDGYVFRQLQRLGDSWRLAALNDAYEAVDIGDDLEPVVGVIVQRAGTRRRYHKRYD